MVGPASGSIGVDVSMTSSGTGTFNAQLGYVGKAVNTAMVAPSMSDGTLLSGVTYDNLGTVTNNTVYVNRVGDSAVIRGFVTAGSTSGSPLAVNLPSGYVIDTTKVSASPAASAQLLGMGERVGSISFGSNDLVFVPFYDGVSNSKIYFARGGSSGVFTKINGSVLLSGEAFSFTVTVPIVSFSGSSQQQGYRADATPGNAGGTSTLSGSSSSSSFADPTSVSGSFTSTQSRNLTCATASSLVGVTCTLPRTGNYLICDSGFVAANGNTTASTQLVDGSGTVIRGGQNAYNANGNGAFPFGSCNAYSVTVGSVTFKEQMKTGGVLIH
jgi:hypothetical protein